MGLQLQYAGSTVVASFFRSRPLNTISKSIPQIHQDSPQRHTIDPLHFTHTLRWFPYFGKVVTAVSMSVISYDSGFARQEGVMLYYLQ